MASPSPSSSANGSPANGAGILYDTDALGPDPWNALRALWRGKWLVLGLALVTAGAAYAYWQQAPKQYRASSILLLSEEEPIESLTYSFPVDRSTETNRALYFLRNSEVFARTVARRLTDSLDQRGPAAGARSGTLLRQPDGSPRPIGALGARVRSAVSVKRGGDVPAVKFVVSGPYPREAALVTNTYAQAFLDHLRASSNARLRTSRAFLERQQRRLKQRLRSIEDSIAAYVRRQGRDGLLAPTDSGGVNIVGGARQVAGEISELRAQKERVELRLAVEHTMLDSTRARMARIRPNLSKRASSRTADQLRQTRKEIATLQSRIQTIQVRNDRLGPELRSELQRMKSRVEQLQAQAHRLADTYVEEALAAGAIDPLGNGEKGLSAIVDLRQTMTERRITITELEARRAALADRIDARTAALKNTPDRTLARLKRRKGTTEELYVALSKSLQKTRVAAESTPPQGRLLRRAQPPTKPIGPNVWQNVVFVFVLGGLLGAGLVLVYNQIDDRVEEPEDIEREDIGVFGAVPGWTSSPMTEPDAPPNDGTAHPQWPGIAAPFSPAAEAYRHVATNLRLGVPSSLDVILVTSPLAGEGKTTMVANLGVALSEAGRDVLMLDADLFGSSLHRKLGCDRAPGLSDWFVQETEAVRTLRPSCVGAGTTAGDGASGFPALLEQEQQECVGQLGVLTAGTEVPQPSLLLQDEQMRPRLETLQAEWDLILIDTSPALSHDVASRLAALSDFVLLVAHANETRQKAYSEALDRVAPLCPGPVAGVLNQYDASEDAIYGYSTYSSLYREQTFGERIIQQTKRGVRRLATGR